MKAAIASLLAGRNIPGTISQQLAAVKRPFLQVQATYLAPGQGPEALAALQAGFAPASGEVFPGFTTMSYSAHFVEVRIEPRTRRVRVPRVVSFVDCGQVISPRTAQSQILGSVVWGISHALRESTEIDARYGAYLNSDLADYLVPVNADIGSINVGFINKPDPLVNPTGLKCLGEIAFVGAAAAVVNAVYHATGKRFRQIPVRIEELL
jgi:xanthine dehydrogenase YagR molybdenum-binding subunit